MPTAKTAAEKPPAIETHPITPPTMRRMHSGFNDHGLKSDEAVHAYLSVLLGHEVEHRNQITEAEGRKAIEDLAESPHVATPALLRKLRAPFPDDAIGKLPRGTCKACRESRRKRCEEHSWVSRCAVCGNSHSSATIHLDYVGHADVTARLLEVDPAWSWEPFTQAEITSLPPAMREGLWIHLTVLGITRPGFGDADGKSGGNAVKECIGDALRNAAMRFGIALDLWAKGDREWTAAEKNEPEPSAGAPQSPQDAPPMAPAYNGPPTQQLLDRLAQLAIQEGTTDEAMSAKWRNEHGGLSMEALPTLEPWQLAPLIQNIETWLARRDAQAAAAQPQGTNPPAEQQPEGAPS